MTKPPASGTLEAQSRLDLSFGVEGQKGGRGGSTRLSQGWNGAP